jgi:hypothetical protein
MAEASSRLLWKGAISFGLVHIPKNREKPGSGLARKTGVRSQYCSLKKFLYGFSSLEPVAAQAV